MAKSRSLLRVLRAAQEPKVTQQQLARAAERHLPKGRTMSPQRYWQIENGEGAEPDTDEKKAVAAALNAKVSDIAWPEMPTRVTGVA